MADLAQCGRCNGYTILGEYAGMKVVVDVEPATRDTNIAAILGGIGRYRVEKGQKGPSRVVPAPLGTPVSFEEPTGAQKGAESLVHIEHGCPATASKALKLATRPPSALVTPGGHSGGPHQPDAPAGAAGRAPAAGPSRASSATPRRSETRRRLVCDVCDQLIIEGLGEYTAIECGRFCWAVHEECP